MKPDFAEAYYGVAVVEEDLIADLNSGVLRVNEEGLIEKLDDNDIADDEDKAFVVSGKTKEYITSLTEAAIKNYELYLDKKTSATDADDVQNHIKDLKQTLNSSSTPASIAQE